ncbi:hypothetical protein K402DRAFT_402403 [Aulographum hederae CBS 113979]|uniref:Uncharacterized protein n=1 Tax=Aulographum hederae CBS 113979 TaxID=1176131 RepID=A0A6G1H856_9PEZI|nr:hypothetical protein K402DRAFT_402403 [Aulographum hederae CBS 113979]
MRLMPILSALALLVNSCAAMPAIVKRAGAVVTIPSMNLHFMGKGSSAFNSTFDFVLDRSQDGREDETKCASSWGQGKYPYQWIQCEAEGVYWRFQQEEEFAECNFTLELFQIEMNGEGANVGLTTAIKHITSNEAANLDSYLSCSPIANSPDMTGTLTRPVNIELSVTTDSVSPLSIAGLATKYQTGSNCLTQYDLHIVDNNLEGASGGKDSGLCTVKFYCFAFPNTPQTIECADKAFSFTISDIGSTEGGASYFTLTVRHKYPLLSAGTPGLDVNSPYSDVTRLTDLATEGTVDIRQGVNIQGGCDDRGECSFSQLGPIDVGVASIEAIGEDDTA